VISPQKSSLWNIKGVLPKYVSVVCQDSAAAHGLSTIAIGVDAGQAFSCGLLDLQREREAHPEKSGAYLTLS